MIDNNALFVHGSFMLLTKLLLRGVHHTLMRSWIPEWHPACLFSTSCSAHVQFEAQPSPFASKAAGAGKHDVHVAVRRKVLVGRRNQNMDRALSISANVMPEQCYSWLASRIRLAVLFAT